MIELVGQPQMRQRRARLDSDVAGPFAFSLEIKYGDATCLQQIWIAPLAAQLAQSGTRLQELTSQRANACPNVRDFLRLTIRQDQEHALEILTRAI